MKLWIDDIRPAPEGYVWLKSSQQAVDYINFLAERCINIKVIDIDHDAGEYANDGGDYINILNWLERQHLSYPIHIHSMNPVGIQNMRAIIKHNNWEEI